MISATEALQRLRAGNDRFVNGRSNVDPQTMDGVRRELTTGQAPFAVILGCSDSRVPVEIIFDQGPGDLFVIRVAGNIAAPSQIGSIEFAVDVLGSRLVVVLGHEGCGAVQATIDHLQGNLPDLSENLLSIVDAIRPNVEPLLGEASDDPKALLNRAVQANATKISATLPAQSVSLASRIDERELKIVGAEYSLGTGIVEILRHPGTRIQQ